MLHCGLDSQGFFQKRKMQLGLESSTESFLEVVSLESGLEGWVGFGQVGERRWQSGQGGQQHGKLQPVTRGTQSRNT